MACMIKNCKSRMGFKKNKNENITFHSFPRDKKLRHKWIAAVTSKKDWAPKMHHRICSKHFKDECFDSDGKWRRLIQTSVPELHLQLFRSVNKESSSTLTPGIVTDNTSIECNKCAINLDHIKILEKKIMKLNIIAKTRLLKINTLKQHSRRLITKNNDLKLRLANFLEEGKFNKKDLIKRSVKAIQDNSVILVKELHSVIPQEFNSANIPRATQGVYYVYSNK